ncbi:serine carboxypeptidase s28 domain-containing protein [Ditylenchus destructor]|nr:serine carboxypeptidase s28 domain-containing protein [Ditylenchus destructor]
MRDRTLLTFLIWAIYIAFTYADDPIQLTIAGRPFFGFTGTHLLYDHSGKVSNSNEEEKFFTQKLDHFSDDARTFQQRFFVNDKFKNSSINILYLEGEGATSSTKAGNIDYPHVTNARTYNATVWVLEHRYYGKSRPFDTTATPNLSFLSSRQAVEDIADFIRAQNKASNENNLKWIVVGSSYAGSLALWFRQKYPGLTVGAIASSASAQPAFDFYGYQKNVDQAYQEYDSKCYKNIVDAFVTIRQLLQNADGRQRLSNDLKLNPSFDALKLTYKDLQHFHNNLAAFIQLPVQYNRVNIGRFSNTSSIPNVCQIFSSTTSDSVNKIAQLTKYLSQKLYNKYDGLGNSYTALINYLKNESYDEDGRRASSRNWLWQQCTEFGYFPSTDYGYGILFSSIPNNFFLDMCVDVFGPSYDVNFVKQAVQNTTKFYHANNVYSGSNTTLINNGGDPWRTLGAAKSSNPSSQIYVTANAGHAADQFPAASHDWPGLRIARNLVTRQIRLWTSNGANSRKQRIDSGRNRRIVNENSHINSIQELPSPKNWLAQIVMNVSLPMKSKKLDVRNKYPIASEYASRFSFIRRLNERLKRKLAKKRNEKPDDDDTSSQDDNNQANYILQHLDQFDSTNTEQWKQYFYINDDYKEEEESPNFLMLGGEGPVDTMYVEAGGLEYVNWVKLFKGTAYALEHRFYGYSQPKKDVSTQNLKWLTTEHALADAAVFINSINNQRKLTKPQWIIFGGSYPGNLAAWMRVRYPQLSIGAVASSAPVQAKTDYWEYLQVVQNSTKAFGGTDCPDNDQDYIDEKDAETFLAAIIFTLAGDVQYDTQKHDYVTGICQAFGSFDKEIDQYTEADTSYRCWTWQSCTEWGYFQSTNMGYNLFESSNPVNFDIGTCTDVFGPQFNRTYTDAAVQNANDLYGGNENFNGTNVVFVNGSEDPWHVLSVLNDIPQKNVTSILMSGTSHCEDMMDQDKSDKRELKQARKKIREIITNWLK